MATESKSKKPKERYLKIPYHILNIGGLGLSEKVLLAYIYGFGEKGCWQNNDTIGKVFFTNPRTVQRWLRRIHKYIYIKCPHGYYRTMWAQAHPDVRTGVKRWIEAERLRKGNIRQKVSTEGGQICHTTHDKSVILSTTNQSVEPRQICRTITNHIKKEITKKTTPPAPLPAVGAGSAVLNDREQQHTEGLRKFKESFGRKSFTPLTEQQFAGRRNVQLQALGAAGGNGAVAVDKPQDVLSNPSEGGLSERQSILSAD